MIEKTSIARPNVDIEIINALLSDRLDILYESFQHDPIQLASFESAEGSILHYCLLFGSSDAFIKLLELTTGTLIQKSTRDYESTANDAAKHTLGHQGSILSKKNSQGNTILHLACQLNHQEAIALLVQKAQTLGVLDAVMAIRNASGKAVRDYASLRKTFAQTWNDNASKLFALIRDRKVTEFIALLTTTHTKGMLDINACDDRGNSLLHAAVKSGNAEMVRVLLSRGCDAYLKNAKGKLAIELSKPGSQIRKILAAAPVIREQVSLAGLSQQPFFNGYLYKWTNYASGYKRRWFVLDNGFLSYYRTEREYPNMCRGSIQTKQIRVIIDSNDRHRFILLTAGNLKLHLKADRTDDVLRWMVALEESCALHKREQASSPTEQASKASSSSLQSSTSSLSMRSYLDGQNGPMLESSQSSLSLRLAEAQAAVSRVSTVIGLLDSQADNTVPSVANGLLADDASNGCIHNGLNKGDINPSAIASIPANLLCIVQNDLQILRSSLDAMSISTEHPERPSLALDPSTATSPNKPLPSIPKGAQTAMPVQTKSSASSDSLPASINEDESINESSSDSDNEFFESSSASNFLTTPVQPRRPSWPLSRALSTRPFIRGHDSSNTTSSNSLMDSPSQRTPEQNSQSLTGTSRGIDSSVAQLSTLQEVLNSDNPMDSNPLNIDSMNSDTMNSDTKSTTTPAKEKHPINSSSLPSKMKQPKEKKTKPIEEHCKAVSHSNNNNNSTNKDIINSNNKIINSFEQTMPGITSNNLLGNEDQRESTEQETNVQCSPKLATMDVHRHSSPHGKHHTSAHASHSTSLHASHSTSLHASLKTSRHSSPHRPAHHSPRLSPHLSLAVHHQIQLESSMDPTDFDSSSETTNQLSSSLNTSLSFDDHSADAEDNEEEQEEQEQEETNNTDTQLATTATHANNSPIATSSLTAKLPMTPIDIEAMSRLPHDKTSFLVQGYSKMGRDELPFKSTMVPKMGLWGLLKNMIGKDLTRLPIPVNFSEPLSMLQRMCEDFEYHELLKKASYESDPCKRLQLIGAFAMSSYASTEHRFNKPFNPMLGETFEYYSAEGDFWYISEQVSHHPPISACHCEGPLWVYWCETNVKSKFRGKSIEVHPLGTCHLVLRKTAEHYTWKKVTTTVQNILIGSMYLDHSGTLQVRNQSNGQHLHLKFHGATWTSGPSKRLEGTVYDGDGRVLDTLHGHWNKTLHSGSMGTIWEKHKPIPHALQYYHFSSFSMALNQLDSDLASWLPPTDCRLRPDQRALEEGRIDESNKLKAALEAAQRHRRKQHASTATSSSSPSTTSQPASPSSSQQHKPKWFRLEADPSIPNGCHWKYLGGYWESRDSHDWSSLLDIFAIPTGQ